MKFDPYEYIGVIVPGAVVLVTLSILYPSILPALKSTLSLGDLGLVIILAFIAGHLIQAGGNLWETIVWWFAGGMPTSWAAKKETSLLTPEQLQRLDRCLEKDFGSSRELLEKGRGPTREIFVRIRNDGKPDRIEKFNRNYGLMRGVSVAFIVSAALMIINDPDQWQAALLVLLIAAIATYRMIRFGVHYGREVYAEYLTISEKTE